LSGLTTRNQGQQENDRIIGAENAEAEIMPEKIKRGVIVEDKFVKELTIPMIRATEKKYHFPYFYDFLEMHVRDDTEISEDVKEYAREKRVRIVRIPMYGGKVTREV
jgi:hypothetical protein